MEPMAWLPAAWNMGRAYPGDASAAPPRGQAAAPGTAATAAESRAAFGQALASADVATQFERALAAWLAVELGATWPQTVAPFATATADAARGAALTDAVTTAAWLAARAASRQAAEPGPAAAADPGASPATAAATATAAEIDAAVAAASAQYGVPAGIIRGVIEQESGGDPAAVSPAGAMGLMQLMPATARALGVTQPFDPVQNIFAGTRYLARLRDQFGGNWALALAAYNAGPARVAAYGGVPPFPETQRYVAAVLARAGLSADVSA